MAFTRGLRELLEQLAHRAPKPVARAGAKSDPAPRIPRQVERSADPRRSGRSGPETTLESMFAYQEQVRRAAVPQQRRGLRRLDS